MSSLVKIFFIIAVLIIVFLLKPKENVLTLKTTIDNVLKGTKGAYAVAIKNLKTEEEYFFNKDRVFEPGSLYKLWLMATAYDEIRKGNLREDDILSQRIEVLNQKFEIDPSDAELTEGEITISVKNAITQMITISHNYSALILTEKVGISKMKEFIRANGFSNSDVGSDLRTTASEIFMFFEKLYKKELVSEEASLRMIEILKKQKLNDGLPKKLPKEIKVAHKTGDIGLFKHDAGIVFVSEEVGDYIIVVLSKSNTPLAAQERIAALSKSVFDYFAKKR